MTARRLNSSLKTRVGGDVAPACKPARAMPPRSRGLLRDVRELILAARSQVARSVDASLTMLYWYGEKVMAAVATRLEVEFGRGFGEKNLRYRAPAYGAVRRAISRGADCRSAAATIGAWSGIRLRLRRHWREDRIPRSEAECL